MLQQKIQMDDKSSETFFEEKTMKLFLTYLTFLILFSCQSKSDKPDGSHLSSYRYEEGKRVLDIGIFINDEPTTNQGELLPNKFSWQQFPSGFSGDKKIGRTQSGIEESLFQQMKTAEAKYVLKIKVLTDQLEDQPNHIKLTKGFFAKTECSSAEETVQIHGSDEREEEGVFNFCVVEEENSPYAGKKIFLTHLTLVNESLVSQGFEAEVLLDRIEGAETEYLTANVVVDNLIPFENIEKEEVKTEDEAFSVANTETEEVHEDDKMAIFDQIQPKQIKRVELPDQKNDPDFQNMMILPAGSVQSRSGEIDMANLHYFNRLQTGLGNSFDKKISKYCLKKSKSINQQEYPIQWIVADIEDDFEIVAHSRDYKHNFYGASVVKSFIGAAWLHQQKGQLNTIADLNLLIELIRDSSNIAWVKIRQKVGDPVGALKFTDDMGYDQTRSHRSYYNGYLGNQINTYETAKLFHDTYHNRYHGAQVMWRVFHTCKTGKTKGKYYLPKSLVVAGKTGSYGKLKPVSTFLFISIY